MEYNIIFISVLQYFIVPCCFSGLAKLLYILKIYLSCTCSTHAIKLNCLGYSYKLSILSICNKHDVNCICDIDIVTKVLLSKLD